MHCINNNDITTSNGKDNKTKGGGAQFFLPRALEGSVGPLIYPLVGGGGAEQTGLIFSFSTVKT